jgi:dienelactone hydrolase
VRFRPFSRFARRPLLAAIVALTACSVHSGSDPWPLLGHWVGTVPDDHGPTPLVLDFAAGAGGPAGTMSLPGRRLLGKKLGDVRFEGGALTFALPANEDAARDFRGRVEGEWISGTVAVDGRTIPIRLRRAAAVPTPYREEQIAFSSAGLVLHGALLLPPGRGPFPAVVLIHGSSTPDRDDYRYYADLYARRGIAALIYDKRPTGAESDGGIVTLEALADDVVAAAAMLARRGDIDAARIGLWGFSQGGWVAPIAATRRKFAFLLACSAPGVTFAEVTLFADGNRLRARGFPPAAIAEAAEAERRVDSFVRAGGDPLALQAFIDREAARPWARYTTFPRHVPSPRDKGLYLRWRDLDLDPAAYWRRLDLPVFVVLGSADSHVPAAESARRIAAALRAGGDRDATIRLYPGADHNLFPAPAFEREMVDWTLGVLRRRAAPA